MQQEIVNLNQESPKREDKLVLSDEEWRKRLTPEQYRILRAKGTEPAFCGVNLESKGPGVYHCVGCDLPLFRNTEKFDSGSGWPSFFEPITKDALWYKSDKGFGMVRTEILCARCDGHLGHVFEDGPPPSGLRYCLNGQVLKFVPEK
ncbi:MAG: peptide-methionine (R)-S-oxide reductase MsrB [Fimbriimonadaceae bacterium]|nr:peptide-methionine (R)-S-oxide reductase MsrB [Fimbriimonadaceae bacterium]QYK56769.1 MAG: peptide-methionine (R)-S-oxide reductase MsrB [Fimbriimonadaceae bacterium]